MLIKAVLYLCLFLMGLLSLQTASCQTYEPGTSTICKSWCEQQKDCHPIQYAHAYTYDRECEIDCANQWLSTGRNETPPCESSTKQLTQCLVQLDCSDLQAWENRTSDDSYSGPCRNETIGISVYCTYECSSDDHCAGWEYCDSGTCKPRPCESAQDCPEGVWCIEGECRLQ